MASGVINWSQTASSNASADSTINWAEGQAPSSVNDSARALMAGVAKWRDDLNGSIATTGTSTAYAVSTNAGQTSVAQGHMVAFVPHVTNGASPTLNINSVSTAPLRASPGVDLAAGVLLQGTPYAATFYASNSGEWILHGFFDNPFGVPIGGGMIYVGSTAPSSNFVLPFGQALSRTTYATLFARCGTAFGSGNGSTTFNVPDMRGRIPVGLDNMGGTAASRIVGAGSGLTGTTIGSTGGEESHTLVSNEIPSHSHSITDKSHTHHTMDPGGSGAVAFELGTSVSAGSGSTVGTLDVDLRTKSTDATFTGITATNSTGGGAAHNNMPPSLMMPWILRVI